MIEKTVVLPSPTPDQERYLGTIKQQGYMAPEQVAACTTPIGPPRPSAFDPDYSPANPVNRRAAQQRRWRYDPTKRRYVDADGAQVADKFGQPL